mmetsp:Transcript_146930/g.471674  ORF Transcript_146930/g.471674 Transcript_146930/m.471674 type:complete len:107 (+) Transcript_146930:222-542(+)
MMPISVTMFGKAKVRVSWPLWEHLFFEIFMGGWVKKVGTSGNIASAVKSCSSDHNACIPLCAHRSAEPADRTQSHCILEFDDFLAHTHYPYGNTFPLASQRNCDRW